VTIFFFASETGHLQTKCANGEESAIELGLLVEGPAEGEPWW